VLAETSRESAWPAEAPWPLTAPLLPLLTSRPVWPCWPA